MAVGIYGAALSAGTVALTVCLNWQAGSGCQDQSPVQQQAHHRVYLFDAAAQLAAWGGDLHAAREAMVSAALAQALAEQQRLTPLAGIIGRERVT